MLTAVTFSLLGFIIGIVADGFEKLQVVPLLVITPLTFLGGSFYSISILPPAWQTVTLFEPRRLPDQRVSLELLRGRRCEPRREPCDDRRFPARMPGDGMVDFQDRLSAQELSVCFNNVCRRSRRETDGATPTPNPGFPLFSGRAIPVAIHAQAVGLPLAALLSWCHRHDW